MSIENKNHELKPTKIKPKSSITVCAVVILVFDLRSSGEYLSKYSKQPLLSTVFDPVRSLSSAAVSQVDMAVHHLSPESRMELAKIANQIVAEGKGILAADEISATMEKRLKTIGVENSPEMRRQYRYELYYYELLFIF